VDSPAKLVVEVLRAAGPAATTYWLVSQNWSFENWEMTMIQNVTMQKTYERASGSGSNMPSLLPLPNTPIILANFVVGNEKFTCGSSISPLGRITLTFVATSPRKLLLFAQTNAPPEDPLWTAALD
jgi:hypothetical protein